MTTLEARFARAHHDNIEAQRRRWIEVHEAAEALLSFLDDGAKKSTAETRLKKALDATRGPWLM